MVRSAALERLRKTNLKTDDDVKELLACLVEPVVSTHHICRNPYHVAPFSWLADVMTGRVLDYIVWACRAGSKSYLAGLATWAASSFMPRLETTILGGSLEQSEKSYAAMTSFWALSGKIDSWLAAEPTQRRTVWQNGSLVSILTASQRSVRGWHPNKLVLDEIDSMAPDIYAAALSQPQSKHGHAASTGRLSTNHLVGGPMDMAIESAEERGIKIFKWCIFDCMESCQDYSCSTCKLSSWCPGPQMREADGYYKIDDFVSKLANLSMPTLMLEWFCEKVGRDDLVYGAQYDKEIHSSPDLPGFDPTKRVYLSIDWGGTNPFSIGVWQKFPRIGWVRVEEVYQGNTTNQHILAECKLRPWWKKIYEAVADPARPDLIREWAAAGVDIVKAINDVSPGIEAVRVALKPVIGNPTIHINPICRAWRREVGQYYEKHGKPVDENSHCMDETRYFTMRYVRKGAGPHVARI